MIVERVLHVKGSGSMDFYAASYFKSYSEIRRKLVGGKVYLYGKAVPANFSPKPIRSALEKGYVIGSDSGTLASYFQRRSGVTVSSVISSSFSEYALGELYIYDATTKKYSVLCCSHCFDKGYLKSYPTDTGYDYRVGIHGAVYYISGYTVPTDADYCVPQCVELEALLVKVPDLVYGEKIDSAIARSLFIPNPLVPPANVITSPNVAENIPYYFDYYLGAYNDSVPVYCDPGAYRWTKSVTTDQETGNIVFSFEKVVVRPKSTLPFINGFACWPSVNSEGNLVATGAAQYLQDQNIRHRRCVLVDFHPVGGASFIRLRDMPRTGNEFLLPEIYNEGEKSLLVVVEGHLILPDKYKVLEGHLIIDPEAYRVEMEADRQLALGKRLVTTGQVMTINSNEEIYNSNDSFIVVVNRPNLQVVRHDARHAEKERSLTQGSSSYAALYRNEFDRNARGLLYDRSLGVVRDYAREERIVTFYAEKDEAEITWGSSSTFVEAEDPLVILKNTTSGDGKSAKVMLFDRARHFVHDDQVVWPRHSIIDFIFRG